MSTTMMDASTRAGYSGVMRLIHWVTAITILAILTLGFWITQFEPKDEAFKFQLYNWHESLGITVWVLTLIRVVARLATGAPKLPEGTPPAIRVAATLNHAALYVVLLAQPMIGLANTNAWGFPLTWFNVIPVPSISAKDTDIAPMLSALHFSVAMALIVLLVLHVAGALYHALGRKDGVIRHMA